MSRDKRMPETGRPGSNLPQNQDFPGQVTDPKDQLLDQLADLVFTADADTFDVAQLDALLQALEEQGALLPEAGTPDPRKGLEDFCERYAPVLAAMQEISADEPDISSKKVSRFKFARLLPIAAIVAVLLGSMMTAQAFGLDVFGFFARWTDEIFGFEETAAPYAAIRTNPLAENEERYYDSAQAMLEDFGITAPLVPTWVPERLGEPEIWATNISAGLRLYVTYESNNEYLRLRIIKIAKGNLKDVEKDDTSVTSIHAGGLLHYLALDKENAKVIWQSGELECRLMGNLTKEEMIQIVNSIYEE